MFVVGELRDKRMLEEILRELNVLGIQADSQYMTEQDTYIITVSDEENLARAQDFFRVKMGLKKPMEIDQQWVKIKTLPRGQTTYAMIVISVVIYLLSFSTFGETFYNNLFIGKIDSPLFAEVTSGQIWRLLTPIFLHMSFLHILFNMMWFKDLGYLIEYNFGKNFVLLFVFATGLISNVCQYLVGGPQFGGMSGVLYAMLGFIWLYKKFNLDFEYAIPRTDIGMMIGWYFLCLTGLLGPIANTAHGSGLVTGMLAAIFLKFKWDRERAKYFSLAVFFFIFTIVVEGYKLNGRYYLLLWKE